MFPGATVFPEGLAIGSSFDLDLVNSVYAAAAAESRAVGIHILSTLVMELDRDPRMGRNEEAYTEDPYLYMRIGEDARPRRRKATDISRPDKVIALLTDFPTQSEPVSGLERGAIEMSERSLRENYHASLDWGHHQSRRLWASWRDTRKSRMCRLTPPRSG